MISPGASPSESVRVSPSQSESLALRKGMKRAAAAILDASSLRGGLTHAHAHTNARARAHTHTAVRRASGRGGERAGRGRGRGREGGIER